MQHRVRSPTGQSLQKQIRRVTAAPLLRWRQRRSGGLFGGTYRDGLNLYAYVGNNPVNRADPSGMVEDGITVTGRRPCDLIPDEIVVCGDTEPVDFTAVNSFGRGWARNSLFGSRGDLAPGAGVGGESEAAQEQEEPCRAASKESGTILFGAFSGTFAEVIGLTGDVGWFKNLSTGTTGYFATFGVVSGAQVNGGIQSGTYSSMAGFEGLSFVASGSLPGLSGSVAGNASGVGGSATAGGTAGIGASAGATYTVIFLCSVGGQ